MSILSKASLVQIPSGYGEDKLYSEVPNTTAGDFTFTRASTGTRVNNLGHIEDVSWNLLKYSEDLTSANGWRQDLGLTTQLTTETNPIGVDSCYKTIADTNTNNHYTFSTNVIGDLSAYGGFCVSFYAKPNGYNWIRYWNNNIQFGVDINIVTGEIENKRHDSIRTILIEEAPNGWKKVSLQFDRIYSVSYTMLKPMPSALGTSTFTGDGVSGMFLWGIQVSKGLNFKPYIKTTDRLDVPRLDYTGAESTSTLIENQFANSENFANATWVKNQVSIVSNTTTSPIGDETADTLDFDPANGYLRYYQTQGAGMLTEAFTFSVYVKYNNSPYMQFIGDGDVDHYANFDIENGIVGTNIGSETTASITDVGSGWYRLSMTCATGTFSINSGIRFRSTTQLDSGWYQNGTAGGDYYIWGAMLQYKTTLGTYVKTEGSLLDYYTFQYSSGTTCPTLLLEPQRTNYVPDSESWTGFSGTGVTKYANQTDINGGSQAMRIVYASGVVGYPGFNLGGTRNGKASIYIKSNTSNTYNMRMSSNTSAAQNITVTPTWQRITVDAVNWTIMSLDNYDNGVWAAADISTCFWQTEEGSFPTSYIPTSGTSVTRVADFSSLDVSSIINSSEGVMYLESEALADSLNYRIISITGTSTIWIYYKAGTSNTIGFYISGIAQQDFTYTITNKVKMAVKWKVDDFAFWVNGTEVWSVQSGSAPINLTTLRTDVGAGYYHFEGKIYNLSIFNQALTDDELEELTTL